MIFHLSFRYAFSHSSFQRERNIRTIISLSLSILIVIVVSSILQFLQGERFSLIRDVKTFDILLDGKIDASLRLLLPESKIFSYGEGVGLLDGEGYSIRYIDSYYDGGLNVLGSGDGVIIPLKGGGKYLKRDEVELTLLKKGKSGAVVPKKEIYSDLSFYYTSLGDEFDSAMIFLPSESADSSVHFYTAIKNATKEDERVLKNEGLEYTTWKEREGTLYSVMKMEEDLVYAILFLLFIIVGVSTKGNVSSFLKSKKNERDELLTLGVVMGKVELIFIISFLIISLIGIVLGGIFGYIVMRAISFLSLKVKWLFTLNLSFPLSVYIVFSLIFILFTILVVYCEEKKIFKKELSRGGRYE